MIVVVADTSPLNYLIQIDCHELLPALYGQVLIPAAVFDELQHPGTPGAVFDWAQQLPPWIDVREVSFEPDSTLDGLGTGEREQADLLLIDERLGVRLAQQHGLTVTGTLGILVQAAARRRCTNEPSGAPVKKRRPMDKAVVASIIRRSGSLPPIAAAGPGRSPLHSAVRQRSSSPGLQWSRRAMPFCLDKNAYNCQNIRSLTNQRYGALFHVS